MISYVLNALSPIKAVWEDIKNWLSGLFNDPVNTIKETFLSLVDFTLIYGSKSKMYSLLHLNLQQKALVR